MIQTFQSELKKLKPWQVLKKEKLGNLFPEIKIHAKKLSYYDLILVLVNDKGTPISLVNHENDTESYMAFTQSTLLNRVAKAYTREEVLAANFDHFKNHHHHLRTFMLGDLVHLLSTHKEVQSIKMNPILFKSENFDHDFYFFEEVLFAPIFDPITQKYMMTDPGQALALLSLKKEDMERFGIEIIFHIITNSDLPEEREFRDKAIRESIEQLAFYTPRIPIKKGSASIYCVILNLDNKMEETAFIRQYKTFDHYTDVIFLNSSLEIQTGELDRILYNGEQVDTIFAPIIQWQQGKLQRVWQ